jgi:MTH538 TIR-like domain (DUF1863)/Tetratricopeptide repeat
MAEFYRYAAFISYSSKDAKFAQRLHRALESYGIPSSLGKFDLIGGGKKNRIYPVFRDREELSAGHLGDQIEANLKASAGLIVVCSPNGAASPWVQKEIEFFAALGRHSKIFAVIPDTAPLVDDTGADCTQSCFPAAFRGDALSGDKLEPLAADARKGKDGFRNAWLKIVGGMIGVSPGQLIDRDRKRRTGRALLNTAAVVATLFAFGLLISTQHRWAPVIEAALGSYSYYDIVMPQSVGDGIGTNARVIFNGIDVGAVQELRVYPNDMQRNMARVVVSTNVPIRADSEVEIRPARDDPQRLVIAIGTGSVEALPLPGSDGRGTPPRLFALFGSDAEAFMDRASLYAHVDSVRALADYNEAIRLNPELASAYHARASLYLRAGDTAAGVADYDRAIELVPDNGAFLRAGCYSHGVWGEQLDQGLAQCDAALRVDPGEAGTLDSRGIIHLRRGDFQAALADFDAAVRADPNYAPALYGRGIAHLRLGQSEAGRADIAAATARDQDTASRYAGYGLTP